MTENDKVDFKSNNTCRFCEKENFSITVRDHCHLTRKCRGPAHSKCNSNFRQSESNFNPFTFHNFSNFDSHLII